MERLTTKTTTSAAMANLNFVFDIEPDFMIIMTSSMLHSFI